MFAQHPRSQRQHRMARTALSSWLLYTLACFATPSSCVDAADFGINIEDVVVTERSGTVEVEIGIVLENLGSEAATFFGYNLFYTYDSLRSVLDDRLGSTLRNWYLVTAAPFTTITDGTQAAGDIAVSEVNLGMSSGSAHARRGRVDADSPAHGQHRRRRLASRR